ncbi:hypothetical protein L1887_11365 [Cichorium endivia]|nr:hypothetical protein L1887_11365 [Cichorium endivia]
MADRYNVTGQGQLKKRPRAAITGDGGAYFLRPHGHHLSESTHFRGIMALLISSGILLFLSGITVTTTIIGLICFAPIIIITSPIWLPISILLFFVVAGVLSLCGLGLAAAAAVSWWSRYLVLVYDHVRIFSPLLNNHCQHLRNFQPPTSSSIDPNVT